MKNNKVLNDCGLRNRGIKIVSSQILSIRFDIDLLWAFPDMPCVDFSESIAKIRNRLSKLFNQPFFEDNLDILSRLFDVYSELVHLQNNLSDFSNFDIIHTLQLQSCTLTGIYGHIYKMSCK